MKKKPGKYLKKYYSLHEFIFNGLCYEFDFDDEFFNLFRDNPDKPHFAYWAFDGEIEDDHNHDGPKYGTEFTPLRQTIVLLCAAMNNEL